MTNKQVTAIQTMLRAIEDMQDAFDKNTAARFKYALNDLLMDMAAKDGAIKSDSNDF